MKPLLRTRHKATVWLFALLSSGYALHAKAQTVPQTLNFQGRLTMPSGNPVPDIAAQAVTFRLYDALNGGSKLWEQTLSNIAVKNGTFAVKLDFSANYIGGNNLTAVFGNPLITPYLEIVVGSDAPLTPRSPLLSVPYAFLANTALTVPDGSLTAAKFTGGTLVPGGAAGGDLSGIFPNPTLATLASSLLKVSGGIMNSNGSKIGIGTTPSFGLLTLGTNNTGGLRPHLLLQDTTVLDKQMILEMRPDQNRSVITSIWQGINYLPLSLNARSVSINTTEGNVADLDLNNANSNFNLMMRSGGGTSGINLAVDSFNGGNRFFIAHYTPASAYTNRLMIDTTGRIGIGTDTPDQRLTVSGNTHILGNGNGLIFPDGTKITTATVGGTAAGDLTGTYPNPTIGTGKITSAKILDGTIAAADLAANIVDNSKIVSDSASLVKVSGGVMSVSGNRVGLGTAPLSTVSLAIPAIGSGTNNFGLLIGSAADIGGDAELGIGVPAGSGHWPLLIGAGGARLFSVTSTGSVGIGVEAPAYKLDVNGQMRVQSTVCSSDARYKTQITPLDNALDSILGLRGVSYNWDREKWKEQNFVDGKQIGFIAQEVEKIFSELVSTDAKGYKSVNYIGVIPVAVEAIKSLKKDADAKQRQIDELKARLARLEHLLEGK